MSIDNLDLNEPVKSSEFTGSKEPSNRDRQPIEITSDEVLNANKEVIIQLSNDSVLHGYDLAIELLEGHEKSDAVEVLKENRKIIQVGLDNSKEERVDGNV